MPSSTVRTFVEALQTGETAITRALQRVFTNSSQHKNHAHWPDLQVPGALDKPLPDWARTELRNQGLTDRDLDHIDDWPDVQKELVRGVLVAAVQTNRVVRFRWELHDGAVSVNDIQNDPDPHGPIVVTFRSPRQNLKLSEVNYGNVDVEA